MKKNVSYLLEVYLHEDSLNRKKLVTHPRIAMRMTTYLLMDLFDHLNLCTYDEM